MSLTERRGLDMRLLRAWAEDEMTFLTCPADDCSVPEYVHIGRVEVDQGGDVVEVAHDGVGFCKRGNGRRGSAVVVEFWCEGGHSFSLRLAFHKGNTVATAHLSDPFDLREGRYELWRD